MKITITLGLAVLLAAKVEASPLSSAAKELARGAKDGGVSRVAVLPFKAVGGREDGRGRLLAADFSQSLGGRRGVRLVERAALEDVFGELVLGQTGAVDARRRSEPGRLAAAEAVVTGDYAALGGKAEVRVRLVRVEDGLVLASARVMVKMAPLAGHASPIPEASFLSSEDSVADVLDFQGRGEDAARLRRPAPRARPAAAPAAVGSEWRDAPNDQACARWQERSDALQAGIIELKARYWAAQAAKKGFRAPAERPGASFFDPALKQRFFDAMQDAASARRPLSMLETQEFLTADREAFTLRASCGA
ncbi:MAG: hypothetical protein HYZ75_13490 [Elusimicrobia bacterium]|nr:hypothetical protein [Elusimicrobiota bacterium]